MSFRLKYRAFSCFIPTIDELGGTEHMNYLLSSLLGQYSYDEHVYHVDKLFDDFNNANCDFNETSMFLETAC